jgi:hypothetical protein
MRKKKERAYDCIFVEQKYENVYQVLIHNIVFGYATSKISGLSAARGEVESRRKRKRV